MFNGAEPTIIIGWHGASCGSFFEISDLQENPEIRTNPEAKSEGTHGREAGRENIPTAVVRFPDMDVVRRLFGAVAVNRELLNCLLIAEQRITYLGQEASSSL